RRLDGAALVSPAEPAHVLPAAALRAARADAKRQQHRAERPTPRRHHHAGAQQHHPHAELRRALTRGLPVHAHAREEAGPLVGAGPRWRALVEHLVAAISVDADRRARDEHLRLLRAAAERLDEALRERDAARDDLFTV